MAKVTLNDVGSILTSANTINNNNQRIEDAIENTLSRDGTEPNEMNADLDMNNNRVYNLPEPVGGTEPARKKDIDDVIAAAAEGVVATQAEAVSGSNNTKTMTPLRTKQQIDARLADEATAIAGINATKLLTPETGKASILANAKDGDWTPAGTGAVARTIDRKLRERPTLFDFISPSLHAGISAGTETTDVTADIQEAITEARNGNERLIGNPGKFYISSTLDFSVVAASEEFGRVAFEGAGQAQTIFVTSVSGTTPALSVNNTWLTNEQARFRLSDFAIQRSAENQTGYGIDLRNLGYLDLDRVAIKGFARGINAVDALSVRVNQAIITHNNHGIYAQRGSFTNPNAWELNECVLNGNLELGARFVKPTSLNIRGGTYEGNGVGGVSAERGGIWIDGNPGEGDVGLNVVGGYFEGNKGQADIYISSSDTDSGVHQVTGATFNRISSANYVTNNVALEKSGTGYTIVSVSASGFRHFNSYTGVSSSERYISLIGTPTDYNFRVTTGEDNHYASSTQVPNLPGSYMGDKSHVAAWVRFNGSTGAINGSHNIDSVNKTGTGNYTITLRKPLSSGVHCIGWNLNNVGWLILSGETSQTVQIQTFDASSSFADFSAVSLQLFGSEG